MSKLTFRLYRTTYRLVVWSVRHGGPLAPLLSRLARRAHGRVVPHSYYAALPNPLQLDGLCLHHDQRASIVVQDLAMGTFEPDTVRVLKDIVKPGMTVLDVGANLGYYSLLAAQLVGPTGTVWAFEPVPDNVELLRKNLRENGCEDCVHVVPHAVIDSPGTARLFITEEDSGSCSLYGDRSAYIDTTATTLDIWAAQCDWPAVDLIKMDIEGAEKAALSGMRDLSRRNASLRLIVEFNPTTLHTAGVTAEEFFTAVQTSGFRCVATIGKRMQPLELPADGARLSKELADHGPGYSVNLLCEKTTIR